MKPIARVATRANANAGAPQWFGSPGHRPEPENLVQKSLSRSRRQWALLATRIWIGLGIRNIGCDVFDIHVADIIAFIHGH
ncbi:hypothetical protein [Noviherbaspirillum pedocola]|uniref:Uncharacterized protein n=1 Tax=Noviherbaspirillum pedocola TaxID=2801341 RepID=A0A934SQK7_9BURK|nr:hypothetical protein [Noviherbaspirillum pedocola]MBK4733639.1 hypothetical protein [Noviherbaspirillum pedocola]